MAAAEPATGRSVDIFARRFDPRWFGRFLKEVSREYLGERVLLAVDRAGWHRAKDLVAPDNVILWFLPPHSPELNPVEQIWRWLRSRHTRGRLFADLGALLDALTGALWGLMDDPERVRSLTCYGWLHPK
jgi:transposase